MKCPYCNTLDTRVTDSRHIDETNTIKRRRKCEVCLKRFTTFEVLQLTMPMIVKNDGRREKYSRKKIHIGIQKACEKRPVPMEVIEKLTNNIEKSLIDIDSSEVVTSTIGNLVMAELKELDPVAYVRFASVYKTFEDVSEFVNNL